ncbi:MAG: hypothetical protein HOK97_22235 [Deltaproteobacteria bacterium]|nr:hypothetical protein [Deltaproteobacteria bacterium]
MDQWIAPHRIGACTALTFFRSVVIATSLFILSGCGQPHTSPMASATVDSILITPVQPWVEVGENILLKATAVFSDGTITSLNEWLEWQSSNTDIATIDPMGNVVGRASGTTMITVTELNLGITGTATLSVQSANDNGPDDPEEPTGPVLTHVTITPSNPLLSLNQTVQLNLLGHYDDSTTATIQNGIEWSSANENVATVDDTGILTSRQAGTSLITATVLGLSATTAARVESNEPTLVSVSISPENPSVGLGETLQLTVRGTFSDGTESFLSEGLVWNSSTSSLASISNTGLLSALSAGAVLIEVNHTATSLSDNVTIVITSQQLTGTGSSNDPWVISAPLSDQRSVDDGASQYYAIPVHPSAKYNVHLRSMTADLGLWVYGDVETYNISNPTCSSLHGGNDDEICSFQEAEQGTLFVRVSGILSESPSSYTLVVEPMPIEELSGTPVSVVHSTEVKEWLIYKVNVTPFQSYRVSISGLDGDADLHVSDNDSTFATTLCQSELSGELEETCNGVTPTTGSLYVGVDATKSWIGTSFNLSVDEQ